MESIFIIIVTPYDGYGTTYIWGVYSKREKAINAFENFVKTYKLEKNPYDEFTAYNPSLPTMHNYYKTVSVELHDVE